MTRGERVKKIRKFLKLTQEDFGAKLNSKKNTISSIESGRNALTDKMASMICDKYHVNSDYLLNGTGEMFSNVPETVLDELCRQYDLDEMDRSIVEMYLDFPEDLRKHLKAELKNRFDSTKEADNEELLAAHANGNVEKSDIDKMKDDSIWG